MISNSTRPHWQLRCEQIALGAITASFFFSMLSVSLTTITYFSAALLILLSGNWRARFQYISHNAAALSFWVLATLFIIGAFYSVGSAAQIHRELRDQSWLLITPLFMMIVNDNRWRTRMIQAFLSIMIITLAVSLSKSLLHINPFAWTHIKHVSEHHGFVWSHIVQSYAMNIAAFICAYRYLFEKKLRLFYGILFLWMAFDILFISQGRTGYGIFFILLCHLFLIRFGWRGTISAMLLTAALITTAFFVSQNFRTRVIIMQCEYHHYQQLHHISTKKFDTNKRKFGCDYGGYQQMTRTTSTGQRIQMFHIAKMMIQHRPWFGYGTGGIGAGMQAIIPLKDRTLLLKPILNSLESLYINFWLWFGSVGLVIFLGMMAVQIKSSFQLPPDYRYLIQVVLITTLFGGLFCSYFDFPIKHLYALFSVLCFSALQSKPTDLTTTEKYHDRY